MITIWCVGFASLDVVCDELNDCAICLGVFVILLLNVMEMLCVVGGALLDIPYIVFHRMCVSCLWSQ